jgi:hypothetical protein
VPDFAYDLNEDTEIDASDLVMLMRMIGEGAPGPKGDFDRDEKVDRKDLFLFSAKWGRFIPEPQ